MLDLLSIGDTRIDNFLEIDEVRIITTGQKEEICLNWGDKIPVTGLKSLMGGNNSNNAVGAVRLGMKAALYAHVGRDENGKSIVDYLKKQGVLTKYVIQDPSDSTEISTVLNHKGERTILIYHVAWDYNLPDPENAKWAYLSSMSPSFSKGSFLKQLENYLERTNAKLMFNPGTHQIRYGVKKMPRILSLTHVFGVNLEEAKIILGFKTEEKVPIKKLLKGIADLGPRMVLITDGGEGSYGFDGEKYYKLGIFPAKLLEMTGAGDAFATGTLAGLYHGKSLAEAMRWGAVNSASVVEHVGPQDGLLHHDALQDRLKAHPKIIAKEI